MIGIGCPVKNGEENKLFTKTYTEGLYEALNVALAPEFSISNVAQACGLSEGAVETFYKHFSSTERVVSVYSQGVNQSSSGTDKVNSIINCHLFIWRLVVLADLVWGHFHLPGSQTPWVDGKLAD